MARVPRKMRDACTGTVSRMRGARMAGNQARDFVVPIFRAARGTPVRHAQARHHAQAAPIENAAAIARVSTWIHRLAAPWNPWCVPSFT